MSLLQLTQRGKKALGVETFIYRIMSVKHLLDLFKFGENVLVSPKKWADPFENFVLKSAVQLDNGRTGAFPFRDGVFGQCWSLKQQSDALWRLYSKNKKCVQVRTTVKSLLAGIARQDIEFRECSFIGRVEYFSKNDVIRKSNELFAYPNNPNTETYARTLLFKRFAFSHEREVRLIHLNGYATPDEDFHKYQVDPLTLCNRILLDPRLRDDEAQSMRTRLETRLGRYGFTGKIKRSDLYALPPRSSIQFTCPN